MARHAIKGSERAPMPGARSVGNADPNERLEVSVILRRPDEDALKQRLHRMARGETGGEHLRHEDFDKAFSAAPDDMAAVKAFASKHGLAVVEEHAARRTVVLSGTVAQFNEAFGVDQSLTSSSGTLVYHITNVLLHLLCGLLLFGVIRRTLSLEALVEWATMPLECAPVVVSDPLVTLIGPAGMV